MPITVMCSVRDVVASTFGRPFFAVNTASATRSLTQEVNSQSDGNMLNSNPGDFELYELGSFDDQTAMFDLLSQPRLIVRCGDLVKSAG